MQLTKYSRSPKSLRFSLRLTCGVLPDRVIYYIIGFYAILVILKISVNAIATIAIVITAIDTIFPDGLYCLGLLCFTRYVLPVWMISHDGFLRNFSDNCNYRLQLRTITIITCNYEQLQSITIRQLKSSITSISFSSGRKKWQQYRDYDFVSLHENETK